MAEPTLYLFDGFNLLHAGGFETPEALRDLLAGWVAIHGARGILVFDGDGPDSEHGPLPVPFRPAAEVALARLPARAAEAGLARLAAESRSLEQVAIVSSDEAVRGTSGAQVRKLSSRAFLGE